MAFIHNLNPVLIDLGPVEIRYYGLVYVIGFILAYFYLNWAIKHKKLSLTHEELYDLVLYLMIGLIVGSRLLHAIFWEPMYYLMQPWKILFVWEGGMAFHGGLLGVAVAAWLFVRKKEISKKLSLLRLGDHLSIPAVFALAFGRIANFINGELPGTISTSPWCVVFPSYDGCRHPQQLYSSLKRFLVFGVLIFLSMKKHKDGFIMWSMLFLMGIGRFSIDFFRMDARFIGLTAGQYLSLIMIFIGAYALYTRHRADIKKSSRCGEMIRIMILIVLTVLLVGCAAPAPVDDKLMSTPVQEVEEQVEKTDVPNKVFAINARQFAFEPDLIEVDEGDSIMLTVTSVDVGHGFALPDFGINEKVPPEESVTFRFVADRKGEFEFFNPVYSGSGWKDMKGKLVVR